MHTRSYLAGKNQVFEWIERLKKSQRIERRRRRRRIEEAEWDGKDR
jgi:hypothetical protein